MIRNACYILLVLSGLLSAGCAERLPSYPWVDGPTALRTMSAQSKKIQCVSASCLLTLQRADGESINLDAAVVIRPPGQLRLRAWKMGQAVFDLTLNGDGVWIVIPENPSRREQVLPAGVSAAQFARGWSTFCGDLFAQGGWTVQDNKGYGDHVQMYKSLDKSQVLWCTVDRKSLTVREYQILDSEGKTRFTLNALDYRQFDSIVWPMELIAISDTGTITIRFNDIEFNGEIPDQAFTPPQRAEKLP